MSFQFDTIKIDCIDNQGNVLYNIASFTSSTVPTTPIEGFAIGNKIRIDLTIKQTGSSDFQNKFVRINPGLFVISNDLSAFQFGYETLNVLNTTPQQAFLNVNNPLFENVYCEMWKNGGPHDEAYIRFEFYVTQDIATYLNANFNPSNLRRFTAAANQGGQFTNIFPSVYTTLTRRIGFVGQVFDNTTSASIQMPSGNRFLTIPVVARWYNSDYDGDTTGMRYIRELIITSPSQIAAGLGSLSNITAASAQANQATNVLSIFNVNSNQLSLNEDNNVIVRLRGDSFVGSANNPPITDVRAMLIRVDALTNTIDFVTDLQLNDAVIPQSTVTSGQLDGAIWTPSDWFENVPNADDIEVRFVLKGSELSLNGIYHIIINIHDSANYEQPTAHITPPLIANYTSPAIPTITGYLSTYNKEYIGNELTIAPHQRIKASIVIDKTSYESALLALGITADFDDCLFGIIAKLQNITGVVNQVQSYIPNTLTPPANNQVLTPAMAIVTNTATELRLECIFRIAEEYAGTTTNITWTLSFNQPISGGTQFVQINFEQKLNVSEFENDLISPDLLAVRFYDRDLYLQGIKREIVEICDVTQIIAEVEKDPSFTGSINLVATIYPATETGDTNTAAIEEEEDWAPITVQMSQLVSGKLDNVETSFGGDDFATFRINCPQLAQGQRYWVTAIAFEQFPNYCPLGISANIVGTTQWSTFSSTGWTWLANATALINDITSHPDYVSGATITVHNITDANNNLIGIQNTSGNILQVVSIPTALTEFYYNLTVEAIFDSGSGPHLIRHTLYNNVIGRPVANGLPVISLISGYSCTDLGG